MDNSTLTPKFITRAAFQWILHQSLVADDRYTYCGLLGVSKDKPQSIQYVAMVKDVEDVALTRSVWDEHGMVCSGLFHFTEDEVISELLSAMPESYTALKVCLGEKGRLDLLAYQCVKGQGEGVKLALDLIEDGHVETDA